MRRLRVIAQHRPPSTPPIKVRPGDRVRIQERDLEWPAFVKVTTAAGGTGWIPARHLSATRGEGKVVTAYDTQEVGGEIGEELTLIERDDESAWLWCRKDNGLEGWIPSLSVEPLP